MRHHAIVVTSAFEAAIGEAHETARNYFPGAHDLSAVVGPSRMNGYFSFFVAPDGSKEGWTESNVGNLARELMITALKSLYDAGHYCDWIEVQYGDDEGEAKVTASGDEYRRARTEA